MGNFSRRRFAIAAGSGLIPARTALGQSGTLTAREVIERIQKNVGVPWRTQTVDTFKTGNPDALVKGIATTFMSTLDMLQRAAADGKNLIITHEPTFYNHQDSVEELSGDPVCTFKQKFIEKHGLIIWRFHDHWHMRRPDGILVGLAETLGWSKYQVADNQPFFSLPATTLGALASDAQRRLKDRTLRVVGDPATKVTRVAMAPGYSSLMGGIKLLRDADVLVGGECREWETVEYAQDAIAAGEKKGLILLGHAISEDPGMGTCATWLKTFISEVPIAFIPSGEPFWRPG